MTVELKAGHFSLWGAHLRMIQEINLPQVIFQMLLYPFYSCIRIVLFGFEDQIFFFFWIANADMQSSNFACIVSKKGAKKFDML